MKGQKKRNHYQGEREKPRNMKLHQIIRGKDREREREKMTKKWIMHVTTSETENATERNCWFSFDHILPFFRSTSFFFFAFCLFGYSLFLQLGTATFACPISLSLSLLCPSTQIKTESNVKEYQNRQRKLFIFAAKLTTLPRWKMRPVIVSMIHPIRRERGKKNQRRRRRNESWNI